MDATKRLPETHALPGRLSAEEGWKLEDTSGFIGHVGPIWSAERQTGKKTFAFVAEEKHANLIGVVQGGMLMTFADRALGRVAQDVSAGAVCVTVQFGMQFMSSARIGELVEIVPEILRRTSSLVFLRGIVTADSRAVGAADGVWKRTTRRS